MSSHAVTVVGAGFAGVEAAWALAQRGHRVRLFEMRPERATPAHTTGHFAELVCSNSLKSMLATSPAGQLKAEMRALGSLILDVAERHRVPGGEALCVDRDAFGADITEVVHRHDLINVIEKEWTPDDLDDSPTILATGPLSTSPVSTWLATLTGRENLYFFDAVSPTVTAASIDRTIAFAQSRYDKGGDDYLNCPFEKDDYYAFVEALVSAERAPFHAFEAGGKRDAEATPELEAEFLKKVKYFAGCTPIEAIAEKGARSLAFGNFKPVGLEDPRTGRRPYAALQLRPENREKSMYSLVACQNRLKWGEQKRVFQMVPGLGNAEFVRYGVIHRNTYVDAPRCLAADLELRAQPGVFLAGQLTGVEGYVESAAMGILAGLSVAARLAGEAFVAPPRATAYGCLLAHLADDTPREFAPMNINWGLFPAPTVETRDKAVKRTAVLATANERFNDWLSATR